MGKESDIDAFLTTEVELSKAKRQFDSLEKRLAEERVEFRYVKSSTIKTTTNNTLQKWQNFLYTLLNTTTKTQHKIYNKIYSKDFRRLNQQLVEEREKSSALQTRVYELETELHKERYGGFSVGEGRKCSTHKWPVDTIRIGKMHTLTLIKNNK